MPTSVCSRPGIRKIRSTFLVLSETVGLTCFSTVKQSRKQKSANRMFVYYGPRKVPTSLEDTDRLRLLQLLLRRGLKRTVSQLLLLVTFGATRAERTTGHSGDLRLMGVFGSDLIGGGWGFPRCSDAWNEEPVVRSRQDYYCSFINLFSLPHSAQRALLQESNKGTNVQTCTNIHRNIQALISSTIKEKVRT